ncbi:MAG TPA: LysE family translocator [Gaiellaceae bacterium]|nr:LysE family translocator [Gaiellaceae bacterium]
MPRELLPFLAVVAALTITPGPDMALVLRNGVRGGSSAAWWTALGCCTGIACYAAATTAGLSALLIASHAAFTTLRLVGGIYLAYLGATALWHARKSLAAATVEAPGVTSRRTAYRQGLVTNLLNPKIALLFLTLIPQFVATGEPAFRTTGFLAGTFLVIAVVWWRVFSCAVGALGHVLARPRVRAWLERVTGCVLVGLGVRVVLLR